MTRRGRRFKKVAHGFFDGLPPLVRYSTAVTALRRRGTPEEHMQEFENDRKLYGSQCPEHGELADPVIGFVDSAEGKRVAFACPWCSGSTILAAWEKEGMRS